MNENYRSIDIGGMKPVDRADVLEGPVPGLQWIKISDIRIDDRFQRPLGVRNINSIQRIAAQFSWGKFAPVVAATMFGGKFSLIDGQHRTHAAALCGFDMVPAMIVVLGPTDQAAAFAAINGAVTGMTAFKIYKAALAANEDWAVLAKTTVESAGCRLMTANASTAHKKPGEIYCLQLIRRFIAMNRADVVASGLKALAVAPNVTAEHFTNSILEPWLATIHGGGGRFVNADLTGFCSEHDLLKIHDGIVGVSKCPEFRDRSVRDLTQASFVAMLNRFVGPDNLPAVVTGAEGRLAERMQSVAAQEQKAHHLRGIA